MEKMLLRPSEAAELLGLSKTKMYALIARKIIPSVRIGKSVRVPTAALREWLNQQVSGPDEAAGSSTTVGS